MLIYDLSSNCAKAYDNGAWSACLSQQPTPAVSVNCAASAINGSYSQNTALTTANTVTIIVVNNSFSPVTITPATSDIVLSGAAATGMSVASVSGPATPGSGGGTATITYTLSESPSAAGTFTATWTKLSLTCAKTATVCSAISAITVTSTTTPSPFAALIAAGNTINFTAAGGSPNTGVTWAMTSSPAGLFSNSASGTGTTASAVLTAGAVGSVTTTFSATNSCGSVVTGSQTVSFGAPPAPVTTVCPQSNRLNTSILPASGSTATVSIGGVSMTVTRTGASSNNSNAAPPCTDAVNSTAAFYLNANGSNAKFLFSKPISNLQFFGSADITGDNFTYTLKNGASDVTSLMTLTKLCAGQGFNLTSNGFIVPSGNNTGQAINVGGVYFTEITINQVAASDIQFDFGICNAVSSCPAISAITVSNTTTPSPLVVPVSAGNTIDFTAAGGTPNTGVTWTMTSSPAGLFSNTASGTGTTASAVLVAGAAGAITTTFTANNACGGVTGSQTVQVGVPPAPATTLCATTNRVNAGTLPANGNSAPITIGGINMTVTRTSTAANGTFAVTPSCTDAANSTNAFQLNGNGTSATFTFSKPVSNLQFLASADFAGDNFSFTLKNGATDVSSSMALTKLCAAQAFTLTANGYNLPAANSTGQAINIGGVYFTAITITQVAAQDIQFDFGICNAVTSCPAISAVTVSNTTTPSPLVAPIVAGNTINFTAAGGTPNTGVTWTMTSSPAGLFSNTTSGTGTTATAVLVAGAIGTVTTTFSANNICGGATGSQTVQVGDILYNAIVNTSGGAADASTYFNATANTWVQITASEYANIAAISGMGKYAATDAQLTTGSNGGTSGINNSITQNASTPQIPTSNYPVALVVTTDGSIRNTAGVKIKLSSSIQTTGYADVTANSLPSIPNIAAGTKLYFILKAPTGISNASAASYIAVYTGSGYAIASNTLSGNAYSSTGDVNTITGAVPTYNYLFQVLATPTKQW